MCLTLIDPLLLKAFETLGPRIKRDTIRFVLEKLPARGATWARQYMDEVEGFDRWLAHVQLAVSGVEVEGSASP